MIRKMRGAVRVRPLKPTLALPTSWLAVLVTVEGMDTSLEAAWKYILITSSGLVLALLGVG